MQNSRIDAAVSLLKQCKAQGKTYYEATQVLAQRGFNSSEVEQASYQFPYTSIAQTDSNQTPRVVSPQPTDSNMKPEETELQKAKQQVNQDVWYGYIPILGAFFRLRWFGDYAKYESRSTGHRKSTVMLIWVTVMLIGGFVALIAAPWVVGFLSKSSWALFASHYIGVVAAVLLLLVIFRAKKKQ